MLWQIWWLALTWRQIESCCDNPIFIPITGNHSISTERPGHSDLYLISRAAMHATVIGSGRPCCLKKQARCVTELLIENVQTQLWEQCWLVWESALQCTPKQMHWGTSCKQSGRDVWSGKWSAMEHDVTLQTPKSLLWLWDLKENSAWNGTPTCDLSTLTEQRTPELEMKNDCCAQANTSTAPAAYWC